MMQAPGLGPKLTTEQAFALELMTRFATNASRDGVATVVRGLLLDNMRLRRVIVEICEHD